MPFLDNALHAPNPSQVIGSLTVTFFAISERFHPSSTIFSESSADTSALTEPETISANSDTTSIMFFPDFNIIDGFVVIPSIRPRALNFRILSMSEPSKKSCMKFIQINIFSWTLVYMVIYFKGREKV